MKPLRKIDQKLDWAAIRSLPKADLHCHLDGSLRRETLIELAKEQKIPLPSHLPFGDGFGSLEAYLAVFSLPCSVLQTAAALIRVTYELIEDAYNDGIWHLEIRFSPLLLAEKGLSYQQQIEAINEGIRQAQKQWPVSTGIILCGLRHVEPRLNLEIAQVAAQMKDKGVVAFDLAGPEHGFPLRNHIASFYEAQKKHVHITVHAGESEGSQNIKEALFECGAERIGHGTHLFEDAELMSYMIAHKIPIEACLSSNQDTGVVKNLRNHPAKKYLRAGAVLTLNTDNRLVSATTLSHEYLIAQEKMGLSADELLCVARNGFAAAFLPENQKAEFLDRFDDACRAS